MPDSLVSTIRRLMAEAEVTLAGRPVTCILCGMTVTYGERVARTEKYHGPLTPPRVAGPPWRKPP